MTLSHLQGHSTIAGLFKYDFDFYVVDKSWQRVARSLCDTIVTLIANVHLATSRAGECIRPFARGSRQTMRNALMRTGRYYDWPTRVPLKSAPYRRGYGPLDIHVVPWTNVSQPTKRHLDRFTCFCTAGQYPTQRHRQARNRPRCDICSNRPHAARRGDAAF